MKTEVNIKPEILQWAVERAGLTLDDIAKSFPMVSEWFLGEKKPTVKQLEDFSHRVHIPFGYLFLPEPIVETLPLTFFRTNGTTDRVSINVFDTVMQIQQRQEWLKDYLLENDYDQLPFVGRYSTASNVADVANDIRQTLNIPENWGVEVKNYTEALDLLTKRIEDKGIITVFNGVVGNNTHREIPVNECRGFVLVDQIAPFMFINNSDWKSAQIFTLAHELAHIWIGESAGFDYDNLLPANNDIEIFCDKVAAEFLVPSKGFLQMWNKFLGEIKTISGIFKVSQIVIARRALDIGLWDKQQFLTFYKEYSSFEFSKNKKKNSGGDFYATSKKRISITFASHIHNALQSGEILHLEAYRLTNMKGDTYAKFVNEYLAVQH